MTDQKDSSKGKLTEHDIALQQELIGLDEVNVTREFHSQVYEDAIRNFALSIGDDNSLYCDPDYAANTHWGSVVAPQIMTAIINEPLLGERIPRELKKKTAGLFRGCQTFVSGGTWDWYRPIKPGDRLYSFEGEESMELKESEFGGKSLHIVHRYVKFNQDAQVVGVYRMLRILSERDTAKKKGKYKDIELGEYSKEDMIAFDKAYLQEKPRGAQTRVWDDVAVDDEMMPLLKGPLTVTDVILAHCAGYGLAPYRMLATARIAAKDRVRMPLLYSPNERGILDTSARVHWDTKAAKSVGNPEAYDWGLQREFWLYHAVSDWMGDNAFVVSMHDEIRRFNYLGDMQTLTGKVTKKYTKDGMNLVDLQVVATNQRGEETAVANATVSLPQAADTAPKLPDVPEDIQTKAVKFLEAHKQLKQQKAGK